MLTAAQLAAMLGCHANTVYRAVRHEGLPHVLQSRKANGARWTTKLFDLQTSLDWIEAHPSSSLKKFAEKLKRSGESVDSSGTPTPDTGRKNTL